MLGEQALWRLLASSPGHLFRFGHGTCKAPYLPRGRPEVAQRQPYLGRRRPVAKGRHKGPVGPRIPIAVVLSSKNRRYDPVCPVRRKRRGAHAWAASDAGQICYSLCAGASPATGTATTAMAWTPRGKGDRRVQHVGGNIPHGRTDRMRRSRYRGRGMEHRRL